MNEEHGDKSDRELLLYIAQVVGSHSVRLRVLERKLTISTVAIAAAVSVATALVPDIGELLSLFV